MAHFTAATAAASDPSGAFWTACPSCCYVHSYPRRYLGRRLLCPTPTCRRPFGAAELPCPPPAVPGTDMYFCSWAFFPLGPPSVPDGWAPFSPFSSPPPPTPRSGPTSRRKVGVPLKGRARAAAAEEAAAAAAAANLEAAEPPPPPPGQKAGGININETVELSELGFRIDEMGFLQEMP